VADGPPANVAPREAAGEIDGVNGLVGKHLGRSERIGCSSDAEDAAAGGDKIIPIDGGAGMKDLGARQRRGAIDPRNGCATLLGAGIAARRHHHGERRSIGPVGRW